MPKIDPLGLANSPAAQRFLQAATALANGDKESALDSILEALSYTRNLFSFADTLGEVVPNEDGRLTKFMGLVRSVSN